MPWWPFSSLTIKISRYHILLRDMRKQNLCCPPKSQFTKIIRTKIVDEAHRTVQDQIINNVAQLAKYLEQIYGSFKNIYQLQGELGSVYQKNEEDVVTYVNRVKLLGKQILEAYGNSGNALSSQNIKASLEKDMCKCFIRGLKPKIEQRIARDLNVHHNRRIENRMRASFNDKFTTG